MSIHFPNDVKYDRNVLSQSQVNKVEKKLPVLKELRKEEKILRHSVEELKQLQKKSSIYFYQQQKTELEKRLSKNYPETKGKNSWQSWIYENNWTFGIHYQTPVQKEKVGFSNIPDFLFPTLDGFLDILEIKKPDVPVIKKDDSRPGSYIWAPKANEAIGQVVNYIHEIELHQLEIQRNLERNYKDLFETKIFTIKPRAFILVGNSKE